MEAKPSIFTPDAFLDGGLSTEYRTPDARQWSAAKMHHVGFTVRCIDDVTVAGALQNDVRVEAACEDMDVRMNLRMGLLSPLIAPW